jgi:hypothetical protein
MLRTTLRTDGPLYGQSVAWQVAYGYGPTLIRIDCILDFERNAHSLFLLFLSFRFLYLELPIVQVVAHLMRDSYLD